VRIRDRVRDLRRVKAGELQPHPRNWRLHPKAQQDALRGVLAEVGYADALVVRELPDGTLQLIDGHLRAETTPDVEVPVLVVDLTDEEAAKLLAVLDPLTDMAEADRDVLADLVQDIETESEGLRELLDGMLAEPEPPVTDVAPDSELAEKPIPEAFQVVVECRDEAEQQEVYERLTAEGLRCKLLML